MQHLSLSWTLWKQKYHYIWHETKTNHITYHPTATWCGTFPPQKTPTQLLYSFPLLTPQVCHHLLDHMITSPYSIIRLAQINSDTCHLRWTTDSSLVGCDAVLLGGCWWFKQSQSLHLQDQAVQENCPTPKMALWFNVMSNSPNTVASHPEVLNPQQHNWDSLQSCIMWHNWWKCQIICKGIYSFGHYRPHEKVSHLRTFCNRKLQEFDPTPHTSDENTGSGRIHGRHGTPMCM